MAQTQTWLDEGIGEFMKLLKGDAASAMTKIVCMEDSSACTALATHTNASPADSHHTDSGLEEAAIDTVALATTNTTDDTIEFDHVFTASATKNVTGIQTINDDSDVAFIECCFNAVVAVESGDTITIDGESTLDQA